MSYAAEWPDGQRARVAVRLIGNRMNRKHRRGGDVRQEGPAGEDGTGAQPRPGTPYRPTTLEVAQRLLARFGARDAPGIAELFGTHIEWRFPYVAGAPWPESVTTRREVEAFFMALFGAVKFDSITIQQVLVDHKDAVILGHAECRAIGTGR